MSTQEENLQLIRGEALSFGQQVRLEIGSRQVVIYGAGLGVAGAALGTALSELVTALAMLYMLCFRSNSMRVTQTGSWALSRNCLKKAVRISVPMAFEHGILSEAQIISTKIVSPLGTVSVAANSLPPVL